MKKRNSSFTIGVRLSFVGLSFLLPLAVMLFFLMSSIRQNVVSTEHELQGTRLVSPMLSTLDLLVQVYGPSTRLAQGDQAAWAEIQKIQPKLRESLAALNTALVGPDGRELFSAEKLGRHKKEDCLPEMVAKTLAPLLLETGNQKPDALLDASMTGINTLRQMIQYSTAETQLSRDPDLDTYNLTLAMTTEIPQTMDLLGSTASFLENSLAAGRATSEDRMEIHAKAAQIQDNSIDRLRKEIEVAIAEDANFFATSPKLTNSVLPALESYVLAQVDLIRQLRETTGFGGSPEKLQQLRLALKKSTHEAQNLSNTGLDALSGMLQQRQNTLMSRAFNTLAAVIVSLLMATLLAIFVSRSISRPLTDVAVSLSGGAERTAEAASLVASASKQLAEGSSNQAASLEETSASLEEMTSMVKRNAEAANKAKTIAKETRIMADTGTADMVEMKKAMDDIKVSSNEIANIVKDIDDIAFQTNILALNAAVEAARAGEAGLGFAVVADEVRNLAQRSAHSARETANKITDAIKKSERGVQISNKVAASFTEIATKTRAVDDFVAEIATASSEQAHGIEQINISVNSMDKVTQTNAACAEESASAANDLTSQAMSVKDSVRTLKELIGGTEFTTIGIPAATETHRASSISAHERLNFI